MLFKIVCSLCSLRVVVVVVFVVAVFIGISMIYWPIHLSGELTLSVRTSPIGHLRRCSASALKLGTAQLCCKSPLSYTFCIVRVD